MANKRKAKESKNDAAQRKRRVREEKVESKGSRNSADGEGNVTPTCEDKMAPGQGVAGLSLTRPG